MNVTEVMTHPVQCCAPTDTLAAAAALMRDHDCGCLPVVDGIGRPVGMITDRDICMTALTHGVALSALAVSQAASQLAHVLDEHASVEVALAAMVKWRLRRLPVTNRSGGLVGLLSVDDLLHTVSRPGDIVHALAGITARDAREVSGPGSIAALGARR